MRIAFLADIHSNLPALEAVVQDLASQAPDAIYLVGDQVNRCPWPNEVMDLLGGQGWPAIYGNHDLVVGNLDTAETRTAFADRSRFPCLWWTAEVLQPEHLQTLRALPARSGSICRQGRRSGCSTAFRAIPTSACCRRPSTPRSLAFSMLSMSL